MRLSRQQEGGDPVASDAQRFEWEQQAQKAVFDRLMREQEPVVHSEDLALLNDLQLRTVNQLGYGVQP
jgi:hypothetical protein